MNWSDQVARGAFAFWSLAWFLQLVSIALQEMSVRVIDFIWFDALSSLGILLGSMLLRGRITKISALFLFAPIVAALPGKVAYYWPSAFVNYFILIYFAVVLLEFYRDKHRVPAYFIFSCYAIYAAIQLFFPVMQLFEGPPHDFIHTLGYSVGALAKGGGAVGLALVVFRGLLLAQWRTVSRQ